MAVVAQLIYHMASRLQQVGHHLELQGPHARTARDELTAQGSLGVEPAAELG